MAAATASTSFIDPQALMRIRNLELRAKTVVEGFWHGLHRSPYHGFSVEFTEYRPYTPGDDPRYLDWRLVARTDRYYIKKYEDETNLRCQLLVDLSRSMTFGSTGYTKAEYASTLAATLGYFLGKQGDAVGLLTFDEAIREYLPPRNRPGHLRQLMLALEKPPTGKGTDIAAPLRRMAELTRKRGLIVLITDFLSPLESLQGALSLLTAARHEVLVFHLLDPAERDFAFDQPSRFRDLESGREIYLDPAVARPEYARRMAEHQAGIRGLCERLGVSYRQWATDEHLELALFDFLRARAEQGKVTLRRQMRA